MPKNSSLAETTPFGRKGFKLGSDRLSFVAVLLLLLVAMGCVRNEEEVAQKEGEGEGTTIGKISENPDHYFGRAVIVSGEVKGVHQTGVFAIGDEDGSGSELLVVTRDPLPIPVPEGAGEAASNPTDHTVQVIGTIQRFVAAEVEREIGFDLQPEVEAEIEESRPVLIARSVSTIKVEGMGGGTLGGRERGGATRDLAPP